LPDFKKRTLGEGTKQLTSRNGADWTRELQKRKRGRDPEGKTHTIESHPI